MILSLSRWLVVDTYHANMAYEVKGEGHWIVGDGPKTWFLKGILS